MNKLNKTDLNKFVPVLEKYDFNLRTKAFKSYLVNPQGGFTELYNLIKQFGFLTETQSKVYAIMLLNYKLNGSSSTHFGKVDFLMSKYFTFEESKIKFRAFTRSVSARTYTRWSNCFNEIKSLQNNLSEDKPVEISLLNEENSIGIVKSETIIKSDFIRELTLKQIEEMLGYKVRLIA